jgi:hypothetical protein
MIILEKIAQGMVVYLYIRSAVGCTHPKGVLKCPAFYFRGRTDI